ncbi:hypothetical protein M5K25_001438 [Dendrobium thyrsiflorum]|uniref:Uncharacterized protein n=1 Tax=Dendrobium thyrsiflorum TaxID=117978 RepID=A0ABD0VRG3_DENTH
MPAGHGLRSRTRDLFARPFRKKGYIPLTTYLRTYKIGEYVDVKVNAAIHKGMPHKFYHGRTGRVWNVTKRAIGVEINKQFPVPPNSPHIPPAFFTNNSFHILHSTRLHPEYEEAGEEGEKYLPEQMPDPIPKPVLLRQHSQIDQLVERFDRWEARFDSFEAQQQQFHTRVDKYIVGNRIIKKRIHVRVEHVQPSRCAEEFRLRKKKNDELKAEAKARGETISTKRQPEGPKPGFMLEGATLETVTPIPYDVVNDLKGGY